MNMYDVLRIEQVRSGGGNAGHGLAGIDEDLSTRDGAGTRVSKARRDRRVERKHLIFVELSEHLRLHLRAKRKVARSGLDH
jgi:hypothetical protein